MVDRNRGNERATAANATGGGQAQATTPGGQSQATTPGGMAHQQATQVKEQVQQTAADLKSQVTEQATGKIEEQKTAASGSLSTLAHAVRQTADQLDGNDQEVIARYIHRAAAQVENVADYIGRRDLRGLAQDTEQFARREPALFLGAAFTVGLFAARFLKSSGSASAPAASGQAMSGRGGASLALPATSSYQPPVTPPRPAVTPPAMTAAKPSVTPPPATASRPPVTPPATPSPTRTTSQGTAPVGGATDKDAIVGGPPISTDIVVGGPPREPGQEPRR